MHVIGLGFPWSKFDATHSSLSYDIHRVSYQPLLTPCCEITTKRFTHQRRKSIRYDSLSVKGITPSVHRTAELLITFFSIMATWKEYFAQMLNKVLARYCNCQGCVRHSQCQICGETVDTFAFPSTTRMRESWRESRRETSNDAKHMNPQNCQLTLDDPKTRLLLIE